MKLSEINPETAKALATLVQQKVMLTNAHQKASSALANFEIAVGTEERYIEMSSQDKKETRRVLRESVTMAKASVDYINGLEGA